MTEIHQILVGAGRTDAITNMARNLRSSLRDLGRSEIFAQHPSPDITDVIPLDEFPQKYSTKRTIIFHASGGDKEVHRFLQNSSDPLVLIFHNITPAHYFENFDPIRAGSLREGWSDLEFLRSKVVLSIADSPYNAKGLKQIGYKNVVVLPLGVETSRLQKLTSDPAMLHRIERETSGHLLLYVGQAVPHKRPEGLIQTQSLLTQYLGRNTSLALVGPPPLPIVNDAAFQQSQRLHVPNCLFLGQVSDTELTALYQQADIFLTARMHEGLCIPVLEAMAEGVPTISRNIAALPDTVGTAGILLPPDAGPELFAEGVVELLENKDLYKQLTTSGKQQAKSFCSSSTTKTFLNMLAELD